MAKNLANEKKPCKPCSHRIRALRKFKFSSQTMLTNRDLPDPIPIFRSAFRMPTSRSYPGHLVQFCEKKEKHFSSLCKTRVPKGSQGFPMVTKGY